MNRKKLLTKRFLLRSILYCLILTLITVFATDLWIKQSTKSRCYKSLDEIPYNRVGLLLGTSKYVRNGYINAYYSHRIDATVALYEAGKIEFILISGDNSRVEYNEPEMMKQDLIARGIPEGKIFLDFAGFRTLDSVVRAKKVFMLRKMTVISQRFHNERAIFIAKRYDIDMIGFDAKDVTKRYGFKTMLREKFARVNMLLDLVFGKDPKFLGEQIEIK